MTHLPASWAPFLEKPLFAFTADQDWAPEWAAEVFLEELRRFRIPLHIFRTNPSPAFDNAVKAGEVEQGWHPNFLPGSSHGTSIPEVIRYCQRNFPGASTVRSHCFAEDTFSWRGLRSAGIVADSQLGTLFQGHLLPIVHWTGIIRFPIYFEDDIFFDIQESGLSLEAIMPTLFTPGLKILNFHPTFVGCNTPSRAYHERRKARIFAPDSTGAELSWGGRGTLVVLRELVARILSGGYHFQRFQALVDLAVAGFQTAGDVLSPSMKKTFLPGEDPFRT
jgi:polysaccharide deactylase WbmS-like protein